MKILILTTSFPRFKRDGTGAFVGELAEALARKADVTVLTPGFPGAKARGRTGNAKIRRFNYFIPASSQRALYPGGIVDQFKNSLLARIQLPFLLLAFAFRAAMLMKDADVVLCNWISTGCVARLAGLIRRRPYAIVVRGTDMVMMQKGGAVGRLFASTLQKASAVCTVAEHFLDQVEKTAPGKGHFTPNGLRHKLFDLDREDSREKLGLGSGRIVVYAGRLAEGKGVSTLVSAMKNLKASLEVLGDGPARASLEEEARYAGLQAVFHGAVEKRDVAAWYSAADIVVLPSFAEGRPNALLEALASARACIASDIDGVRELVTDGENGLLFPAGDSGELRNRIESLLNSDSRRKELGAAARARVLEAVPSWDKCAERYIEVLSEIAS